jgi:pimeloyl-ACP methyl ester carboxylesterase
MTARFFTAYDELLARWGLPVDQFELTDEFGTTHVNACGPPDAPPLVLLAGHGATSPVWFGLAPRLAKYRRVYAIDLIGDAGRSTNSGRKLTSPADLHAWLTNVLDGLDVARAGFCGHSYGAWLSLTFALHAPARVDKLALLDPTDCFTGLRASYVARALPALLRPTEARFRRFLRWETQGVALDPQWLELAALASELPAERPVRPRSPKGIGELQAELLVVIADRSKSQNPDRLAARVAAVAPGATVVRLPGATHHSLPAAHTDEVSAALENFL